MDQSVIRPLAARVEAIAKNPRPSKCSLLGMIDFYRRFIRGVASILKLLTTATKDGGPKHRKLDWWPDIEQSFKKAKVDLSEKAILAHP